MVSRTFEKHVVDGSVFTLATGVFASTEALAAVANRTLAQVVDKALDDPEVRAALR